MTGDDSIKCRCMNSGRTSQVGGFQNRGVCLQVDFQKSPSPLRGQKRLAPLAKRLTCSKSSLQAFPFFLPHPLPALLLAPFFPRSLTLVPRSLLLNRTETLAKQATYWLLFKGGRIFGAICVFVSSTWSSKITVTKEKRKERG